MTIDCNKTDEHSQTYKKADWTQFTEDTESAFAQTNFHMCGIMMLLRAVLKHAREECEYKRAYVF